MRAFLAVSVWLASVVWLVINLYHMDSMIITALIINGILSYLLFRDTLNAVQAVGPVYWIYRDIVHPNTPLIAWGYMRQTSAPWRVGKGIQIKVRKHTFQIGLSRVGFKMSDEEGLMSAVQGRYLKFKANEIGDWK
jgi:hypothetical protein